LKVLIYSGFGLRVQAGKLWGGLLTRPTACGTLHIRSETAVSVESSNGAIYRVTWDKSSVAKLVFLHEDGARNFINLQGV
jgi:hypothetical protein